MGNIWSNRINYSLAILVFYLVALGGFSGEGDAEESLREVFGSAGKVAVSVDLYPDEFVVSVSPVRQTLQIIHSSARLAGAFISEVQNDKFRKKLQDAVGELNVPMEFKQKYLKSLEDVLGRKVEEVPPMGSSAKYSSEHEARLARIRTLKNRGYDVLIDVKLTAGIYGPEGEMFFRLGGTVTDLKGEKTLWRGEVIVSSECKEMKITLPFKTYFNPFKSNYFSPRLTIADDALTRWTNDNGKNYFEFKEEGIDLAIEGFFTALGLKETAKGWFGLGMTQIYKGKWKKALEYFDKAVSLEPENVIINNAKVVALYRTKKVDEAIDLGEKIVEGVSTSERMFVYYNLSYIYAKKKKDLGKAKEYYQKYLQLGGEPDKRFNPMKKS